MTGPPNWGIGPKKIASVYVTTDVAQAELVKNALIAEGILCELERQTQGGLAESVDVRVLVRMEDFDRARSTIEKRMQRTDNT